MTTTPTIDEAGAEQARIDLGWAIDEAVEQADDIAADLTHPLRGRIHSLTLAGYGLMLALEGAPGGEQTWTLRTPDDDGTNEPVATWPELPALHEIEEALDGADMTITERLTIWAAQQAE